jgi:DNA-binding MarR family transcriptional regulator
MGALRDEDYRALARFRHALRVFQSFSEEAARRAGVTPAQHLLLLAIRGHPGDEPPVIGELAESLQLRHNSAVELIDRAEQAALIRRVTDPYDRRRQRITLTPTGRRVLADLTSIHRDELRRFRQEMLATLNDLDG